MEQKELRTFCIVRSHQLTFSVWQASLASWRIRKVLESRHYKHNRSSFGTITSSVAPYATLHLVFGNANEGFTIATTYRAMVSKVISTVIKPKYNHNTTILVSECSESCCKKCSCFWSQYSERTFWRTRDACFFKGRLHFTCESKVNPSWFWQRPTNFSGNSRWYMRWDNKGAFEIS